MLNIILALVVAMIFWGSAFVGIREALSSFSPGALALARYMLASVTMLILFLCQKDKTLPQGRDLIFLIILGILGIAGYNIGLNYGEQSVPAGTASFIVSQMPIIMGIIAMIFLNEKMSNKLLAGTVLGVIGVSVIALGNGQAPHFTLGVIYILLGTVSASIYSTLQKPFLAKYSSITIAAIIIWSGTFVLFFFEKDLQNQLPHATLHAIIAVAYLGIFPAALAYVLWGYAVNRLTVTQAASSLYSIPIATVLIGWLWLHEWPTLWSIIGGLIALSGAVIVNLRTRAS